MNLDRICDNRTPLRVACLALDDSKGRDMAVCIAKLTFERTPGGGLRLAVPQAPVRMRDEHFGPLAGQSGAEKGFGIMTSVRYPSDRYADKPGTDVLLLGTAWPPPGETVGKVEVRLRLASEGRMLLDKAVHVYGVRTWYRGVMGLSRSEPQPLRPTPLRWELTYGGAAEKGGAASVIDWRNPIGGGVGVEPEDLVHTPAPNIEGPEASLGAGIPPPAGFGPIPPTWEPRRSRHGTRDALWARERAPLPPLDFDPRANSCAPPDQHMPEPLKGGEACEVIGATRDGRWMFSLPAYGPRFEAVVRGEVASLPSHLDTVLIDGDEGRIELTWRASLPLPRRTNTLEVMRVGGALPRPLLLDYVERVRARRGQGAMP